ncbi:MAG: MqnA/MqnD/SBP family protein [Chitinophagaceae bacterium]
MSDYVRDYSQEMEDDIMRRHIDLYVNDYSSDLGSEGRKAIHQLLKVYQKASPGNFTQAEKVFLSKEI